MSSFDEKIPPNMEKMMACLNEVNSQIIEMKDVFNVLDKKSKKLSHLIEMMIKKEQKNTSKNKRERKPCGFAVSSKVTPEMCEFMGKNEGELISRIEITKYLNKYIGITPRFIIKLYKNIYYIILMKECNIEINCNKNNIYIIIKGVQF